MGSLKILKMYNSEYSDDFKRILKKIYKKDRVLYERIKKKIYEICENPEHYKPLGNILFGLRRTHIGSLVLTFKFTNNIIYFVSLKHHDEAY